MMVDFKYNVEHNFEVVYNKLKSEMILNKQISGELPIYVQTYPIEYNNEVNHQIKFICERLNKDGIKTIHINVYEMALDLLEKMGDLSDIVENEQELGKQEFREVLCGLLTSDIMLEQLSAKIDSEQPKIVLLSGFNALYPYIRANTILNNVENIAKGLSFVFFYPGRYENQSLLLFNEIKDGNYYRAHNLDTITI